MFVVYFYKENEEKIFYQNYIKKKLMFCNKETQRQIFSLKANVQHYDDI
jgi:hypothetical protein